ncbi:MAG TPA: PilZ domain-containing protein [Terriglobia bacterium]|nr:PilZ domain-containing protein [Terriglobia bacterium]
MGERRKHRRYILTGRVRLRIYAMEFWGDLVNFGAGGMLIRTPYTLPEKTTIQFLLSPDNYPDVLEVSGQVVGGHGCLAAIQFLEHTNGARFLLQWLAAENYPWTGGEGLEINDLGGEQNQPARPPAASLSEAELETSQEWIYQNA